MNRKIVWVVASCLVVLALLVTSCTKAEEKAPAPTTKEAAPAAKEAAPVVKEAAPVVKEAAPAVKESAPVVKEAVPAAGAEMVKVTLKKLDGTRVEKLVEKPRYGGKLVRAYTTDLYGWDETLPGIAPWPPQQYYLGHTYEDLIEGKWEAGPAGTGEMSWQSHGWWDPPPYFRGALAESWEFPDATTIVFHIRQGVRWQNKPPMNGRELTADDVAFSIRRTYITSTSSTMYSFALESRPTDVYAKDKYTVVVKAPPGQLGFTWEFVAGWMRIYPPEVVQKYGNASQWENVVGTGPFILSDYVKMSAATWVRNPDYWGKDPLFPENQLPYVDKMTVLVVPDQSTRMAALRTGKIDQDNYETYTYEEAQTLIRTAPQLKYNELPPTTWSALIALRLDKPGQPWCDIRVRRALYMAMDFQKIVDTYFSGKGQVLNFPIPLTKEFEAAYTPIGKLPLSADGFDNNKLYTYHPEDAKKLLAEAGYPNGFKVETVASSVGTLAIDLLLMTKDYWSKIGVDLTVDIKEPGVCNAMYAAKTYKEGYTGGGWADQPYILSKLRAGNFFNHAMVVDPKMDEYYKRMTELYFEPAKRDAVLKEAFPYIVDKVYYFALPAGNRFYFWQPWLKGYHGEIGYGVCNTQYQKYLWIDQELKKSLGY